MSASIEDFFKKYLWIIRFVGIAIVVAFAGSAVATLVGARVFLGDEAAASAAAPEADDDEDLDDEDEDEEANAALTARGNARDARNRAKSKTDTAAAIVARNIFCPTCQPVEAADPEAPADGPVVPGEIKSTLPLNLLITMVSDDPLASMATIEDTEKGRLGAFSVKDQVRPGVSIEEIHRARVVLLNGRQREYIEIGQKKEAGRPTPANKPEPKKKRARRKNSRAIEGADEAISCDGDSCTVERKFVDKLMANPALLAKQARVIPDKNGRGFKFYGVRNGSLPKLLGVKNGDLVTEVNGQALTSVDQAMGLYTKLRRASNLSVTIDRRGKTVTKDITIK